MGALLSVAILAGLTLEVVARRVRDLLGAPALEQACRVCLGSESTKAPLDSKWKVWRVNWGYCVARGRAGLSNPRDLHLTLEPLRLAQGLTRGSLGDA